MIAAEADLPNDFSLDRLNRRRSLLDQLETLRRNLDQQAGRSVLDQKRELAFSLLDSKAIRAAFDLEQEPAKLRDEYGLTLFGQSTLQARRLVEAGCRFVTVVWDEFGQLNAGWDTHVDHYNRLTGELLPGLDLAFSALIRDLEARGMLDDTLVLVMNEMGRTPRFEGKAAATGAEPTRTSSPARGSNAATSSAAPTPSERPSPTDRSPRRTSSRRSIT